MRFFAPIYIVLTLTTFGVTSCQGDLREEPATAEPKLAVALPAVTANLDAPQPISSIMANPQVVETESVRSDELNTISERLYPFDAVISVKNLEPTDVVVAAVEKANESEDEEIADVVLGPLKATNDPESLGMKKEFTVDKDGSLNFKVYVSELASEGDYKITVQQKLSGKLLTTNIAIKPH